MSTSTILDGNSFSAESLATIAPATRRLIERRARLLGPSYRLFYREPLHLVRGLGTKLYDGEGEEYLDAYNNVASVGHANPRVTSAVAGQMATLNTHTRYIQEGILTYAEEFLDTMPPEINRIMFTTTGSEANDLALRIARYQTGAMGVVVSAEAYHGTSDLTAGVSPAMGSSAPLLDFVETIPSPDTYRIATDDLGAWFADQFRKAAAALRERGFGVSAFLADSIFSSDGVYPEPRGYLAPLIAAVHEEGAIYIADEVQPGFGRTGQTMWGFQAHGIVPDIVTTGKAMGNGVPVAAMAIRSELLENFGRDIPYFNTFGGNPVSIAAAQAVFDVIREDQLMANAATVGRYLREGISDLSAEYPEIGDVRGAGLYIGVEFVTDRETKTPDSVTALNIVNAMRERRVLISSAGPHNNVLKVRPPLVFTHADADRFHEAFAASLTHVRAAG